ncbi:uncharacterized protein TrAFT101_005556 [Trichoderma asperellum]|uniref:uncharacterized protein n=1 Tax=Trichoderma asperellum TaxID=101201 RepID=UPI00332FDDDA|nr:hypothetical protein TrAFT101_005556 [Trichoderma asperellum]
MRSSKTPSKKAESVKAMKGYESELELDASKISIDETMTGLTSFAETPAKEMDASKIAPSFSTPDSLGPQRPRRSAAAAATASIKRSYEEYGEPLAEAAEIVKKARKELPAVTLPAKMVSAEADEDNHQTSTSGSPENRRSSGVFSSCDSEQRERSCDS